jgi:plastocyanin
MMKTTAMLAAAALGLAACGSSSNTSSSSSAGSGGGGGGYGTSAAKTTKTTAASSSQSGKSTSEIDMFDNYFKGKTITGKSGSTVKIKLKNEGSNDHNFKIDSQLKQADADVKPGQTATVSVTIPKSGTLQFYCEYHKGLGMTGTVKPS